MLYCSVGGREVVEVVTADSEVRAPNMRQLIKEEVQALVHSTRGKLDRTKP